MESNSDAPLARRETKIRSDYNVLNRGNRVEITDYGWLHEQDNKKIVRIDSKDIINAMEKGYNTYQKISDEKCQQAINLWNINSSKWEYVRNAWNKQMSLNKDLIINSENNSILLYKKVTSLNTDSINSFDFDKMIIDLVAK